MGAGGKVDPKSKSSVPTMLDTVWKIKGKYYDLSKFAAQHPGGERALMNAAAHPRGEYFVESYHPDPDLVYKVIEKYEIKGSMPEIKNPVKDEYESKIDYTFEPDGFYRKVKKAGMLALRGKNKKSKTNLRGDDIYLMVDMLHLAFLFISTFLLCMGSWKAAIATGVLRGAVIMRIAHVASHSSLSPYPEVNHIMYYLSMVFAGTTPEIWSRKHVVRHHVNTNEDDLDEDRMEPLKCVFNGAPYYEFHKNQHKYIWGFYVHVVAAWAISDIIGNNFRKSCGPVPFTPKETMLNMATQFFHVLFTYALPIYFQGFFYGLLLIELNTVLTSTIFGFEFIVNHEIEGCDIYPETVGKTVDWGAYQTISSADFHPLGWGSWFFNQLTGGLNLQICHHLFPGIHYRHYPTLTKIIYEHAEKENIQALYSSSVVEAVTRHYEFLKKSSIEFAKNAKKVE
eukprot:TRINITY_DN585_c0_g3_i1.p1 TRINITY_DN585_c0_g3~~TRINITY_DN585_c0_g3_i1.p1  ORF type:complete len:453 (+),score=87.92 TRINITY_DN585_c0_g3_i1:61-1419(+)